MSHLKVVMTARVLSRQEIDQYKTNLGIDFQNTPCNIEDENIATAHDAGAIITLMQPYSQKVIENLQRCKLIFNAGTGFNTIDVRAAIEYGICVVCKPFFMRSEGKV